MTERKAELHEFSAEQLREELRARFPSDHRAEFVRELPVRRDLFRAFTDDELLNAILRQQKLVYGVAARVEVSDASPAEQKDARTVAGLFSLSSLRPGANDGHELDLSTFGETVQRQFGRPLAAREPFQLQPIGPLCSACLVAPDLVITVGRLVSVAVLARTRFVFDFQLKPDGSLLQVKSADVYRGIEVVDSEVNPIGDDWAVVRLDRPVIGRTPAALRRRGQPSVGQRLHVIGHPLGLPMKIAGGSIVRGYPEPEVFFANLDVLGGGPGSPVFNSDTHEVEGILVRGGAELVRVDAVMVSLICPEEGALGALCSRASLIPLPGDEHAVLRLRRPYLRGAAVQLCQERLARLGLSVPPDGVFGPKTRAAVRALQRREQLEPTGIVDQETQALLMDS